MSSNLSHNESTVAGMTSDTGWGFIVAEYENRDKRVEYCDPGKLKCHTGREVWRQEGRELGRDDAGLEGLENEP